MVTLACQRSPKWWLWHADAFIEKSAQFHAERTDRELLGRPVARYSGVVVSDVIKSHADGRVHNFMQKEPIERFWDALWLAIQPFLYFSYNVKGFRGERFLYITCNVRDAD